MSEFKDGTVVYTNEDLNAMANEENNEEVKTAIKKITETLTPESKKMLIGGGAALGTGLIIIGIKTGFFKKVVDKVVGLFKNEQPEANVVEATATVNSSQETNSEN